MAHNVSWTVFPMRFFITCCFMTILLFIMPGCSDSSSGTHQGQFIDSPVEGLTFETQSISGTTDSEGVFLFSSGERVTFSIGGIVLGSTRVRSILTPVDLVPGARDENDPAVVNIVRLLLTLDQDGDPENGITIIQEISDALAGASIIFKQTPESFSTDPEVLEVLDTVNEVYAAHGDGERSLRSQNEATSHMAETLQEIEDYAPHNDGNSGAGGGGGG